MQSVLTYSVFPSVFSADLVRAPWWENWQHFAWPVRVPKSGISQIWKKYKKYEIFGILHFSQICKIPLVSTIQSPSQCLHFLGPGYVFFVNIRQAWTYHPCSRQKMPGCSWGRLSEARGVWGAGNLEGGGLGRGWVKGGQFTSNLGARKTGPVTARRVPSK